MIFTPARSFTTVLGSIFMLLAFAPLSHAVPTPSPLLTQTVAWDPVTQNIDSSPIQDLSAYKVYILQTPRNAVAPSDAEFVRAPFMMVSATTTTATISQASGTYWIAVQALDTVGNRSGLSNKLRVVLGPDGPIGQTPTPTPNLTPTPRLSPTPKVPPRATITPLPSPSPTLAEGFACNDFDRDGYTDGVLYRNNGGDLETHVIGSSSREKISVYSEMGRGEFAPGDYDGDGNVDIASLLRNRGGDRYRLMIKTASQRSANIIVEGRFDLAMAGCDFNGNGRAELAALNVTSGRLVIDELGLSSNAESPQLSLNSKMVSAVACGDVDGRNGDELLVLSLLGNDQHVEAFNYSGSKVGTIRISRRETAVGMVALSKNSSIASKLAVITKEGSKAPYLHMMALANGTFKPVGTPIRLPYAKHISGGTMAKGLGYFLSRRNTLENFGRSGPVDAPVIKEASMMTPKMAGCSTVSPASFRGLK